MGQEASEGANRKLRFESGPEATLAGVASHLAESIAHETGCDYVSVTLHHQREAFTALYPAGVPEAGPADGPIFSLGEGAATFAGRTWTLPLIINDLQRARVPGDLALELAVRKVRSGGIFPVIRHGALVGVVECFFTRSYHRWRQEELDAFAEIGASLAVLGSAPPTGERGMSVSSDDMRSQYRRMARYGNIIIIMTDADFGISDVFGNTERIVGLPASRMLGSSAIWDSILDPRDRDLLRRRIKRLRLERDELREEVRVVHQQTGEVRWMMLRAVPHFSAQGHFLGWEGFGIDITDRRQAQEALLGQNRRLEALFEVSRALQGQVEPSVLVLKGLKALLRATSSHCGYAVLLRPDGDGLEVAAAQGLSEEYLGRMEPVLKGPSLLWHVVEQAQGVMIDDLQADPRASLPLAQLESIHAAVIVPLIVESQAIGALALFKREARSYADTDYDLAQAAAAQVSLAVRQADMFESERRHTESLSALYRLSHELGKYRSVREIAENAFPILEQEFALRRGWLGIMNDQGTHIVGQAGFGPGVKKRLQQVQVELSLRHDFLDDAIRTQRPVMIKGGQQVECSGLNGIIEQLGCELIVVIPLVSLGQVVGVVVVEPRAPAAFVREGRLQLLVSMANEMATVFMARRFEHKMSESFKMRMAGLLAAGVAHNFNNLLQAILGQVSLIELQSPAGSKVLDSTGLITDAAKRGASLVSQLLSFSTQSVPSKQNISLNGLISSSAQLYESLLGRRCRLSLRLGSDCPDVVGDPSQIQQVITALLANAKDAMVQEGLGSVMLSTTKVRLRSGEIDPDLAPGVYIRLDVKDTGVGMTSEQQSRCFEPFYTTKNVDRGTGVGLNGSGLGLSSAYSIIKQHDGLITVHSVPGEGTTFSLYMPVLSVKPGSGAEPEGAQNRLQPAAGVILLGMETGTQPYFSSVFESLGYRSRSAFDGVQAMEILRREPAGWGFIALDLDAVGEAAADLCSQLLQRFPELCLVGIGAVAREWLDRLPHSDRLEVVDKPVGVWAIESAMQRLRVRPSESQRGPFVVPRPTREGGAGRRRNRKQPAGAGTEEG